MSNAYYPRGILDPFYGVSEHLSYKKEYDYIVLDNGDNKQFILNYKRLTLNTFAVPADLMKVIFRSSEEKWLGMKGLLISTKKFAPIVSKNADFSGPDPFWCLRQKVEINTGRMGKPLTGVELAVIALMMEDTFSATISVIEPPSYSAAFNLHHKVFASSKLDSRESVISAMFPWTGSLGEANMKFIKSSMVTFDQIKILKNHPQMIPFFRRICAAIISPENDEEDTLLQDVNWTDGISPYLQEKQDIDDFMGLSFITHQNFQEKLSSYKVSEFKTIISGFPLSLEKFDFMEWMDYKISDEKNTVDPEVVGNVVKAVTNFFDASNRIYFLSEALSLFKTNATQSHVKIMSEYAVPRLKELSIINNFSKFSNTFTDRGGVEWCSEKGCVDYLLSKMITAIGVEATVDALIMVSESDELFTANQWLKILKNYATLEGIPVSWWESMIA